MAIATPKGKRIRTMNLYHNNTRLHSDPATREQDAYTFMDDFRIIGFMCSFDIALPTTPTTTEGRMDGSCTLSRSIDPAFGPAMVHRMDIGLELDQEATYNLLAGDLQVHDVVMFPEGHGIDVEEGETIYISSMCRAGMLSAGSGSFTAVYILYMVER